MILVAIVFRLMMVLLEVQPDVLWYATPAQVDSFGMGILLALKFNGGRWKPTWTPVVPVSLTILGLALLVASYFGRILELDVFHRVTYLGAAVQVLPPVTVALLVLSLLTNTAGGVLSSSPIVYLGKISYGLYLLHLLVINYVGQLIPSVSDGSRLPLQAGISLVVTIGIAMLSYRWFEAPFLRLKARFTYVSSRGI